LLVGCADQPSQPAEATQPVAVTVVELRGDLDPIVSELVVPRPAAVLDGTTTLKDGVGVNHEAIAGWSGYYCVYLGLSNCVTLSDHQNLQAPNVIAFYGAGSANLANFTRGGTGNWVAVTQSYSYISATGRIGVWSNFSGWLGYKVFSGSGTENTPSDTNVLNSNHLVID